MAKVRVVRVLVYEYSSEGKYLKDKENWTAEFVRPDGSMKMTSTHLYEIDREDENG